jgi:glycosyltransferase involved in cell wall biosynthesis
MTVGERDLSVIIATRNRAGLLAQTLGGIGRQELGNLAWEVVVVDNGSVDDTPAVLRAVGTALPLVVLQEPRAGKNRAMNRALEVARGRLLIFTDDDVEAAPGWLAEMAAAAGRWKNYGIFGGPVLLTYPEGTPDWVKACVTLGANFPLFVHSQPEGPINLAPFGPNYAVRREALAGVRFDENIGPGAGASYAMGSETELLLRLMRRGVQAVYVPGSLVHHVIQPAQLETAALLKRGFRSGRSAVRLGWDADVVRPGRQVLRAPRYLWRMALEAGTRYAVRLPAGRRASLAAGLRFAFLLGCLYEYRSRGTARGHAVPLAS